MRAPVTRLHLALASLWNRRVAVCLTMLGIGVAVALILAVERVRLETRENFSNTVAGTDLIVGARTSPVQLLLYSVFRIGAATSNMRYDSFEKIRRHPTVAWAVPIALGDSHRGFSVVGTTPDYFRYIRHGRDEGLAFAAGMPFDARFEAVIGAEVARQLRYAVGDRIIIAHGARDDGLSGHETLPFTVSGILARTGTPADRAVHVQLAAIAAIHVGWESGVRVGAAELDPDHAAQAALEIESLTAFFMGLKRKSDVLQVQRAVNGFPAEPLVAVLPGAALNKLWNLFGTLELALIGVSTMTVATGLIGMVVGLFSTLNERRREMAVLRSVGARPADVAALLVLESSMIGTAGALLGYLLLTGALLVLNPLLSATYGLSFSSGLPQQRELLALLAVVGLAFLTGLLPAWRAYRMSLQDGLDATV